MSDLENKTYVVLEFATAGLIRNKQTHEMIFPTKENIIEVAAVKIENGKITKHFSTFVAIDGYEPDEIEFDEDYTFFNGITEAHLIGAPSLKSVCQRVYDFAKNACLIVRSTSDYGFESFNVFKKAAKKCGYDFNHRAIAMNDICLISELKSELSGRGLKWEDTSLIDIASIMPKSTNWIDTFCENNIFSLWAESDDLRDEIRRDSLGWALAFAQQFIYYVELEEDEMEERDKAERKELEDEIGQSFRSYKLEPVDDSKLPF